MKHTLAGISGQPLWIVQARPLNWLRSAAPEGWVFLLGQLDIAVRKAVRHSATGKVTLIGHSAGGVVSRLYLSPEPFRGHVYRGADFVSHLITLGSPHHNQRGGGMRGLVEERYPGSFFSPQVRYTSVAGKLIRGDRHGSLRERWAYRFYERLCGDGTVWGDGLVPVPSAVLRGSHPIIVEGVSHFTGFGGPWYGTSETAKRWWNASMRTGDSVGGDGRTHPD